jgi:very-short-patch-repair endonuclease
MSHDAKRDAQRDEWFISNGWLVLRIADFEVLESLGEVIELVLQALQDPSKIEDPLHLES